MFRYLTAGESHGKALITIIEGLPANLDINKEDINKELKRRQIGFGRGQRMSLEKDKVNIISGIRWGKTLGSPLAMEIKNKDWENWQEEMSVDSKHENSKVKFTKPRPGHADLAGVIKYHQSDIRNILERASARETASRVAAGAVSKILLKTFEINISSHTVEIGGIKSNTSKFSIAEISALAENSELRCADKNAEKEMIKKITNVRDKGDSLGGIFEVIISNLPIGLGSHVHWDRKLDGQLSRAIMSIQGIKGVEIGLGFEAARRLGSEVHDEIYYESIKDKTKNSTKKKHGFYRKTNNAGGIEGGISNGEDIIIRAVMKPIPTLRKPLSSVDLVTKKPFQAEVERSDVCAVPAAGVVGEATVAFEIAKVMIEKFGGDSLEEMKRNFESYLEYIKNI